MLTSSSNPGASKSTSKNLGEFGLNVHELEDVSITLKQRGASTNLLERDSDAKGDPLGQPTKTKKLLSESALSPTV
jgi:hypothetical protein